MMDMDLDSDVDSDDDDEEEGAGEVEGVGGEVKPSEEGKTTKEAAAAMVVMLQRIIGNDALGRLTNMAEQVSDGKIGLDDFQASLHESSLGNLSLDADERGKKSILKPKKKDIDDISFASSPSDDEGDGGEIKGLLEYIGVGGVAGMSKEPSTSTAQPVAEMAKHQVYLKKLNYQEKVSEEVKKALKPVFAAKTINKDQYKDIMRKVVSKTTNSYDGRSELNAKKVKTLVESYVKKYQEVARKDEQKRMKKELDDLVASKIG